MVGLVPLFAAAIMDDVTARSMPAVSEYVATVLERRPHLRTMLPGLVEPGDRGARLLAVVDRERLEQVLQRVLDESEFLSPFGIRSLSRRHRGEPFQFSAGGKDYEIAYLPGASDNRVFGGNSNWRGPIWFPMNFLLIQSFATFARYYGPSLSLEYPTGSGRRYTLPEIADDLSERLTRIFVRDGHGRRAVFGDNEHFQRDIHWRDYVPVHEFFHG